MVWGQMSLFFFLNWPRETFPRNRFQLLGTGGDARRGERSPQTWPGARWLLGTAEALPQDSSRRSNRPDTGLCLPILWA